MLEFNADQLTAEGASRIDFRVTTNPGQPLQPLGKVASGVSFHELRWRFR